MMALTIGLNPILVESGPLSITWHGVLMVLAVVSGILIPAWLARSRGLAKEGVYAIALWAMPWGLVGARLFHVLDDLGYYAANPWQMLAFWEGGFSLYGGLLGGAGAGVAYAWLKKLPVRAYADLSVPGLLAGQIVGRIGDIINGAAYGSPTSLPWALVYTHPNAAATTHLGIPGQPTPVYEILWGLAVLALAWRAWGKLRQDGMLFLVYLAAYSLGRFVITFWRQDRVLLWGLQQAHIVALLVIAMSLPLLYYLHTRAPRAQAGLDPRLAGGRVS